MRENVYEPPVCLAENAPRQLSRLRDKETFCATQLVGCTTTGDGSARQLPCAAKTKSSLPPLLTTDQSSQDDKCCTLS